MTRMECGEVRDLLHAYSDHELPTQEHRAVATHVEHCSECAEAASQLEVLRQRVRKAGTYAVPPALEQRVRSAIGAEDFHLSRSGHRRWAVLAASHLLALVLGGLVAYGFLSYDEARERLIGDVVSAHVRAFLTDQPVQIASADTHTVKPWFVGRLPTRRTCAI
jgi:anti-sigma factor RsiW